MLENNELHYIYKGIEMMIKPKLLILTILLTFSGCATHQKFVERHNSWVGKEIKHFITHHGYPDRAIDLPNKNKVYIYEKRRVSTVPISIGFGYYGGPFYPYGGYGMHHELHESICKLYIETNRKGKIVKWNSKGNDCRSN
jgi:hypothetical protein